MYFTNHPKIELNNRKVVNIFIASRLLKKLNINDFLLKEYTIKDGETPELLSYKLYNTPNYHWIIIIINSIVNLNTDWPLSYNNFLDYVNTKYNDPYGFHHYEDDDGTVVDAPPGAFGQLLTDMTVTNLEYETRINDDKSKIKVIHSSHIVQFALEFKKSLKGVKSNRQLS